MCRGEEVRVDPARRLLDRAADRLAGLVASDTPKRSPGRGRGSDVGGSEPWPARL